ncbi:hypothetical protein K469DRAFT_691351 [Zopfia rhizophila CBS 207.26]|uniref:Uncharacterized protein n=1 Tax=Zopfia rhizophila CBS 207.26 TaxID=1314779 RepID=A0A6A6EVD9_9PEZI|nr:hypothetical protein K469DRAFT_691351 [Zopfia rhizophila CBS 207.26]
MLRLRPSEITLTPADVEETRRRIARRQAALPSPSLSTRAPRAAHVRPGIVPRLRLGPEHSRDDAVTSLGNIPILRPQQGLHSSAESDSEDDLPQERQLQVVVKDGSDTTVGNIANPLLPVEQPPSTGDAIDEPAPTPSLNMQLAFRPAPKDVISSARTSQLTRQVASIDEADDDAHSSSPKHQFGFSGFGRATTNTSEERSEDTTQPRLQGSTDGVTETPHTGPVNAHAIQSFRQHSDHAPSPLHQARAASSPQHPEDEQCVVEQNHTEARNRPTLYLQGYFESPERYTFQEYMVVPHTEPRQRSRRSVTRVRTTSSHSDAHTHPAQRLWSDRQQPSSGEDIFWSTVTSGLPGNHESEPFNEPEVGRRRLSLEARVRNRLHNFSLHSRYRDLFGRTKSEQEDNTPALNAAANHPTSQRLSGASSSSSLPYSYYELPISRCASSNYSQAGEQLPQAQFDGSVPSRQLSQGAYYSVRPSRVRPAIGPHLRPPPTRASSYSSPDLTADLGHHGFSPLPASPYTRVHSAQSNPRPSTGLVTPSDFVGDSRDAASAARRNLSSPLDLLEQRASSHLSHISSSAYSASSQPSSRVPSVFQYQVAEFDDAGSRRRRTSESDSVRYDPVNSNYGLHLNGTRYPGIQSPRHSRTHTISPSTNTPTPQTQSQRRGVTGGRLGQRLSENVPAGSSSHEAYPTPRASRAQGQGDGQGQYDLEQNSQGGNIRGGDPTYLQSSLRSSVSHNSSPRDRSNIPQLRSPYQARPAGRSPQNRSRNYDSYSSSPRSPHQAYRQGSEQHAPAFATMRPYQNPRNYAQHHGESQFQRRLPTRSTAAPYAYRERQAAPQIYAHRQPESLPPSTQLRAESGNTRPSLHRAVISHRRIIPQQQNQENSGDAEAELMREEMLAAGMRYAEDGQQLEVMDETPPRLASGRNGLKASGDISIIEPLLSGIDRGIR